MELAIHSYAAALSRQIVGGMGPNSLPEQRHLAIVLRSFYLTRVEGDVRLYKVENFHLRKSGAQYFRAGGDFKIAHR